MKILIFLMTLLSGCGAVNNTPCYVEGEECNSQGEPGDQGPQGDAGARGVEGSRGDDGVPGPRGTPGMAGNPGADGRTGDPGPSGAPGVEGQVGATGPQGVPGADGQDASGYVIFNPCGDLAGWDDQVVLVLPTGEWILNGYVLESGETYRTSDKQKCVFTVPG